MEYIYAFDGLKKHTISFNIIIEQYLEKANGVIDMYITGIVTETKDGKVLHKESKSRTFTFKNKSDKQMQHDLNVSRIRYADEQKWILSISNNESATDKLEVGVVSETANKNPAFVDVYSNDSVYSYYIKGNNIAQLEAGYAPPILDQTIINYTFDQAGVPDGFVVESSTFDSEMQAITTDYFDYLLPSSVPKNSPFIAKLNIVPTAFTGTSDGSLFKANFGGIGDLVIYPDRMTFLNTGFPESSMVTKIFNTELTTKEQLYNYVYTKNSELQFGGDGKGNLTISYNNEAIIVKYDESIPYQTLSMHGGVTDSYVNYEGKTIEERMKQKVDNISVTFRK